MDHFIEQVDCVEITFLLIVYKQYCYI